MKKIILNLIILAAIIAGYIAYQKYNNQQMTDAHKQLDAVKIQESSDGGSCTDDSDCDSGDCDTSTDTCKGNCANLLDACTNDGDCCHDYYCDTATSTCGSAAATATLSATILLVGEDVIPALQAKAGGTHPTQGAVKSTVQEATSDGDAQNIMQSYVDQFQQATPVTKEKAKRSSSKKRVRKKNNLGSNYHGPREANVGINRTKPIETIQSVARKNAGKEIEEALEVAVETGS